MNGVCKHFSGSQHVLYHIFRYRRNLRVDDVAEATGIPASTLHKYIMGQMACPIEILHQIFIHFPHPLLKELVTPKGYELIPNNHAKLAVLPTVEDELLECHEKITDWLKEYKRAIEDGSISYEEMRELNVKRIEAIDAIERTWIKMREIANQNGK